MQSFRNSTLVKLKIQVFIGIEHLLVTTISNIIATYFFDPNLLPIGGEQLCDYLEKRYIYVERPL